MAQLQTLRNKVTRRLGTAVEDFYTPDKKNGALNLARTEILLRYDVDDFIKEDATISFTSGVGTLPTDFFRKVKGESNFCRDLFNASTEEDYQRVSIARFDDDISLTWTVKQDGAGDLKINIFEASTVTLTLRYIEEKTDMSVDTDESGFSSQFDEAHARWAAAILLFDRRLFEEASVLRAEAEDKISEVMSREKLDRGAPTNSKFDQDTIVASPGNGHEPLTL